MIEVGKEKLIVFDPFSLDLANECLWRGSKAIKLRPKAFAVINYLLGRPGRLVTKEELLNTVWPETFVGDAVLKVAIRQLRAALDDNPKSPRFIETAHRRGYRFIGQIAPPTTRNVEIGGVVVNSFSSLLDTRDSQCVIGRDEALERMSVWLKKVVAGERQTIFVTGEAGIGKTALVDAFLRRIAADPAIRIAGGQCLEQYGTSEAFLPVLDAIARLCRERPEVVEVLRAHAPMWLLQMPSLVSAPDREMLSREIYGVSREQMLRAMGEALGALAEETPLVLILEDLHWSDYSTLDLISYLARQRGRAQLMLIGTYRPVDLIVSGHPLKAVKQELMARQLCEELPLNYLSAAVVGHYLTTRFPANNFPAGLAALIHERTEGNPLFMVNTVDYLGHEGLVVEAEEGWELVGDIERVGVGVPDSIKQLIEKQIDYLAIEQQRILEAASVAGAEFSTLAVAAELKVDRASVETCCDELARQRQFIQDCGVQLVGNEEAVTRYGFIHALYQNVLYERVSESRRIQLHRRIGEHYEHVYGESAAEIAAELSVHFERGRDFRRAAKYLQKAANNAIRRFAYREAVGLARRGIELIEKLPDTSERAYQQLCLQLTLGVPLVATEGYAASSVGKTYLKARELYQRVGDKPEVSEVLWGLWTFHTLRAELETARKIAEEFLRLADRLSYPGLAMRGHWALEIVFMHMGEFALTLEQFHKALDCYEPDEHRDDSFLYALNPGVAMPCFAAWSHWFLGEANQSLVRVEESLRLARELSEPHGLAHALFFAAVLYQLRRDTKKTIELATAAIAVSQEHGLVLYQSMLAIVLARAQFQTARSDDAIEQMRQSLAELQAMDAELLRPYFLALLAECLSAINQSEGALALLDEALEVTNRNGERFYEAELHRLKGEVLLSRAGVAAENTTTELESTQASDAEACFNRSIKIAQQQNAKSLELRATASLARVYQQRGKQTEARELIEPIYYRFGEGFDTQDLSETKALLDGLSRP